MWFHGDPEATHEFEFDEVDSCFVSVSVAQLAESAARDPASSSIHSVLIADYFVEEHKSST